ncbi:ribonuclease Z [Sphingobacterium sp. SG20118]|uniref:ribonuclease Z n=1 Tax=Sphingobacterium TaxID=28453 RepID=UPI0004F805C6|nr:MULTISPECIES: ribonuclease Z [Sphingobacterium]AIM35790.1 ribonuclease Z [Sphingobacterium sp. ML3W]MDH5828082.1 ribonuclease Z [Sphingobacterium faecium]
MRFEVLILGNSSATPMYDRHPTSQVVNFNEQLFLIDCGEGTQMQLTRYGIKSNKINHIFISHLHGDHYLGLVGLLSSMHLIGRKSDLHLYGPKGLDEILAVQFRYSETTLRYNLIFHETSAETPEVIFENRTLKVSTFPLTHRIPCTGFRFDEGQRSRHLLVEEIEKDGIPVAYYQRLKNGVDYVREDGHVFKADDYTLPGPLSRSYVYCSDTVRTANYLPYIQHASLMYHESTFLHEMVDRAKETFHTTALEAGEIAKETHASKLLLGHYSARYKDLQPLLLEAQSVFQQTMLSQEGKWFSV